MANLDHPNIIQVDDFGETEGRYWLRMELAEGVEVAADRVGAAGSNMREPVMTNSGPGKMILVELPDEMYEAGFAEKQKATDHVFMLLCYCRNNIRRREEGKCTRRIRR